MSASQLTDPLLRVDVADRIDDAGYLLEAARMAVQHLGTGCDGPRAVEAINVLLRIVGDQLAALSETVKPTGEA